MPPSTKPAIEPGALPRRRDEPHEARARERVHHGQSDKGDKRQKLKPKGREVHPMQAVDPTAQKRPIARIGHEREAQCSRSRGERRKSEQSRKGRVIPKGHRLHPRQVQAGVHHEHRRQHRAEHFQPLAHPRGRGPAEGVEPRPGRPEASSVASRTKDPTDSSDAVGRRNSRKKRCGLPRSISRQNAESARSPKPTR